MLIYQYYSFIYQLNFCLLIHRYFNIVSISKEHGIGILDEPVTFSSMRPIHFYCEGPGEVHRGESVGIRCMVMNRSPYDLEAVIVLKGNPFLNNLNFF